MRTLNRMTLAALLVALAGTLTVRADSINVTNSAASLDGKTLLTAQDAAVVTGALSFQRAPDAPFDVETGSAVVTHLDADLLDGEDSSDYHDAANLTGVVPAASLPDPLPILDGSALTNLDATHLTGTIPDGNFPATLPVASGVNLTHLTASNLDGTIPNTAVPNPLPAVSGANLTNLDASDLASGTVPRARISTVSKLYAQGGSVGNVTTTPTNLLSFTAAANDFAATGDGLDVEIAGSLASNTNNKVLAVSVGGVSYTLFSTAANVAANRFLIRISIVRDGATTCRISGSAYYGGTYGAAVTPVFWGGYQMTGLVGWGSAQTVSIVATGVSTNDIVSSHSRVIASAQ